MIFLKISARKITWLTIACLESLSELLNLDVEQSISYLIDLGVAKERLKCRG